MAIYTQPEAAAIGGRARQASMTDEERKELASLGGKAVWAKMSPEQRTAEMKRRAAVRKARKK